MKKILVLHNNYQIRGGEDIAVKNEIQLLREKFEVEEIYFNNFIENYFTQFFYFLINKNYKSIKIVKNKLETFNPDIVYIHNTWFKISTGIFKMLSKKDVKVFIKVTNDTPLVRSGLDLIFKKSISLKDALCGLSFDLPYINGKTYKINNDIGSIIQPGYRKVIPDMGMERDNVKGSLVIEFNVEFPEKLSIDNINKLKDLL